MYDRAKAACVALGGRLHDMLCLHRGRVSSTTLEQWCAQRYDVTGKLSRGEYVAHWQLTACCEAVERFLGDNVVALAAAAAATAAAADAHALLLEAHDGLLGQVKWLMARASPLGRSQRVLAAELQLPGGGVVSQQALHLWLQGRINGGSGQLLKARLAALNTALHAWVDAQMQAAEDAGGLVQQANAAAAATAAAADAHALLVEAHDGLLGQVRGLMARASPLGRSTTALAAELQLPGGGVVDKNDLNHWLEGRIDGGRRQLPKARLAALNTALHAWVDAQK